MTVTNDSAPSFIAPLAGSSALRGEGSAGVGQHAGAIAGSQEDVAEASATPRVKKKPRRGKKLNYKPEH